MSQNLAKKKSFIHKAFRENDGSGTDFDIKVKVKEALRKYGIRASIPTQDEKFLGVRPDLLSKSERLVVEIHGSKFGNVHEKSKVQHQDEYKFNLYKSVNYNVVIIDYDLLQYLGVSVEQYIAPILMNLKKLNCLQASF